MGAPKDETKNKGYNKANNNTSLKGVTPSFTVDRALTYTVGILVFGTGAYIIYRFVKAGVEGLDKKGEDSKKDTDNGKVGNPILVYSETIQTPSAFPVQATNLNFPSYDRNVQFVQEMMMRVFGNVLPSHGADGKFGLETKGAVQMNVNATGMVTKADWEMLVKRASQIATIAKQATQNVEEQTRIAVMPSANTGAGQKDLRYATSTSEIDVVNRPIPETTTTTEPTASKNDAYAYKTLELSLEGLGGVGKHTVVELTF